MKRWPKKREFLTYYLLYKSFGCREPVNVGELSDRLSPYFGRRVSVNILRRLARLGFIVRVTLTDYRVECLENVLERYLASYLSNRERRLRGGATPPRRSRPSPEP